MAMTETGGFLYDGVTAGRGVRAGLSRRAASTRPLPMEDLCFFVKTIDNSRLVRVVDPGSKRECLGLVLIGCAVFLMALLMGAPYVWMLRSGYRIEDAKKQLEQMVETNRQLQVKEAVMRDPQRIYSIAVGKLGMRPPAPERVVWAESESAKAGSAGLLARNLAGRMSQSAR